MKKITNTYLCFIAVFFFSTSLLAQAPPGSGWTNVFEDNFNGNAINENIWWIKTNTQEKTFKKNALLVNNGTLKIRNWFNANGPTGGWIQSKTEFAKPGATKYGYYEARIRITGPNNGKIWPTWWIWGNRNGSSITTEFDLMEYSGAATRWFNNNATTSHHSRDKRNIFPRPWNLNILGSDITVSAANAATRSAFAWHKWGMHWTPNEVSFYYDNVKYFSTTQAGANDAAAENRGLRLILSSSPHTFNVFGNNNGPGGFQGNNPLGANLAAKQGNILGTFEVDWVRVWTGGNINGSGGGGNNGGGAPGGGSTTGWIQIAGSAQDISIDNAGKAWVANAGGQMYVRNGNSWAFVRNNVQDVGAGRIVSTTGTNNSILSKGNNTAPFNTFSVLPGSAVRVDVDNQNRTWVVNGANQIYRRDGGSWTRIPGNAVDIGCSGTSGTICRVDTAGNIHRYNANNTWARLSGGGATRVDIDKQGRPWVVSGNTLFRYNPSNNTWTNIRPNAADVACGVDGSTWITGTDAKIYRLAGAAKVLNSNSANFKVTAVNSKGNVDLNIESGGDISVEVYNMSGQSVYSDEFNTSATNTTIQLRGDTIAPGIYVAKVTVNGSTKTVKIVL